MPTRPCIVVAVIFSEDIYASSAAIVNIIGYVIIDFKAATLKFLIARTLYHST